MNWIDAIILIIVIAIISGVIACNIISHKKGDGVCSKCAYSKDCAKQKKKIEARLKKEGNDNIIQENANCCTNENSNENKNLENCPCHNKNNN